MRLQRRLAIGGGIAAVMLFSCGGGGGGGIGGTGIIRMALTDAPACGYDAVNVTIEKLRVHADADAAPNDAGWADIVLAPAQRVDLLTLQNGVLQALGETALVAGHYSQVRMVLAENGRLAPLANSVVPSGQAEAPLDTQGSSKGGIKIKLDQRVEAGQVVDVVLDFDACRSIVRAGDSGRFKLKPVVTAMELLAPGAQGVVGYVDPSLPMADTRVSVQAGGVQVKATTPDSAGKFFLYPVPIGKYDLVVSAAGRVTAVVTGVPVDQIAFTYLNSALAPIAPANLQAGDRVVAGRLQPATATVRAWQKLSDGATVEAAYGPVDSLSGGYSVALPIDAPWTAAYAPDRATIAFAPDEAAAGQYTVEASSEGRLKWRGVDTRQPVPPVNFTFP
ncbi:MAG TPA: DUF4382 domain-containing protein [Ideonella sp.]|uniref:DUF4382 domain-containing protein n=1 Tax=Ideonella sp. TaxID=1929293 RepID=UPI002E30D74A|nr:DUF4382 domain-containing protein [Ideonella sp.]HEX5683459.1 DUF4382 domain-containing protein [Ideonella sp.]